jgi:hypothetical protein
MSGPNVFDPRFEDGERPPGGDARPPAATG